MALWADGHLHISSSRYATFPDRFSAASSLSRPLGRPLVGTWGAPSQVRVLVSPVLPTQVETIISLISASKHIMTLLGTVTRLPRLP